MLQGIDLSHSNDPFNWDHLSPDVSFVICKASQGATFKDKMFLTYLNNVRGKNLVLGAYHFLNFTDSAEDQAANFLSRGTDFTHPGTLPPIVDIENQVDPGGDDKKSAAMDAYVERNKTTCIQLIKDYLTIIEEKTKRKPIIYTYNGFWGYSLGSPDFSQYPLWVSCIKGTPRPFSGWLKYTLWQFSVRGSHISPDDNGGVDWSRFDGSLQQLNSL